MVHAIKSTFWGLITLYNETSVPPNLLLPNTINKVQEIPLGILHHICVYSRSCLYYNFFWNKTLNECMRLKQIKILVGGPYQLFLMFRKTLPLLFVIFSALVFDDFQIQPLIFFVSKKSDQFHLYVCAYLLNFGWAFFHFRKSTRSFKIRLLK